MSRVVLITFVMIVFGGCGGPSFTNLGNGVAVPPETIGEYAELRGITRAEARARMREESDKQRISDHAKKYGVPLEEAKEQLEHTGQ